MSALQYRGVLREHSSLLNALLHALDWVTIAIAAWLTHWLYLGTWILSAKYLGAIGIGLVLTAWIFPRFHLYRAWRGASLLEEMKLVSLAWGTVLFLLFALAFSTKAGAEFSRGWVALWAPTAWVGLLLERVLLRVTLRWLRRAGFNIRHIVIVGTTDLAREVAGRIARSPWAGLEVVGFFHDSSEWTEVSDLEVLGNLEDVADYVQQGDIDQVWIAMALKDEDKVRKILHALRHCTVDIRFVPDIFGFRLLNHSVTEVAGLPVLDLSTTPMVGTNRVVKALEDRFLAALILILISPLMAMIAIGVKLSSPGPVFYRQERVGWNGKPFMMLKFRSMPVEVEKEGVQWGGAQKKDTTAIGAFLRRTSLDELPQFLNVLKGDMSIVGPRPERPVFVERFKEEIPDYMKKHLVKAGITGWAQINGWRGDTDLGKRIEYDLYYIENWSLWFDLKIVFLTIFKGFVNKNAY